MAVPQIYMTSLFRFAFCVQLRGDIYYGHENVVKDTVASEQMWKSTVIANRVMEGGRYSQWLAVHNLSR